MKYVIAIVVILALSFLLGFVLGAIWSDREERSGQPASEQEKADMERNRK